MVFGSCYRLIQSMHIVAIVHYQFVLVVCCNKNAVILQHWMLTFAKHLSIWVCMCVCRVGDSTLSCLCQRVWGEFQCLLGHFIWVQTLHFYFTIPEVQLVAVTLLFIIWPLLLEAIYSKFIMEWVPKINFIYHKYPSMNVPIP